MTIVTSTPRASALATAGLENNPFVTGALASGAASTTVGTEVESAANAVTGSTYDPWVATPDGANNARWQYAFGSAQSVSFVGIAAHNITTLTTIQYSLDGGTTWVSVGSTTPTEDEAMGFRFAPVSATHWRVAVNDLSANVSIGVIWLGAETIIPQRIYQGYAPVLTPTIVDLNTNVTEGAQLVSTAYIERGSNINAQLDHIPEAFIRDAPWQNWQRRWNRGEGSFWAWRPSKYGDLHYMWRGAGSIVQPVNSGPRALMSFGIQGRAYHGN